MSEPTRARLEPTCVGMGVAEWPVEVTRLYVVACDNSPLEPPSDDERVWTLSPTPDELGWENDCNCSGYGLPKAVAQQIADAFNARIRAIDKLAKALSAAR